MEEKKPNKIEIFGEKALKENEKKSEKESQEASLLNQIKYNIRMFNKAMKSSIKMHKAEITSWLKKVLTGAAFIGLTAITLAAAGIALIPSQGEIIAYNNNEVTWEFDKNGNPYGIKNQELKKWAQQLVKEAIDSGRNLHALIWETYPIVEKRNLDELITNISNECSTIYPEMNGITSFDEYIQIFGCNDLKGYEKLMQFSGLLHYLERKTNLENANIKEIEGINDKIKEIIEEHRTIQIEAPTEKSNTIEGGRSR